jgi:hypothetical protein
VTMPAPPFSQSRRDLFAEISNLWERKDRKEKGKGKDKAAFDDGKSLRSVSSASSETSYGDGRARTH